MTNPLPPLPKKPRHRSIQRQRAERAAQRVGIERRGNYIGTCETRRFDAHVVRSASTRSTDAGANATQVTGTAIVYGVPYTVHDGLGPTGSFTETMSPGVVRDILATTDARLLVDHNPSMLLARTASGTMSLRDGTDGLHFVADLDPRDTDASNALVRIERGDLSQCSVGFIVANDVWNSDYTSRRITKIERLDDCSLVSFPASETTSVALAKKKPKPWDEDPASQSVNDGTQNAPVSSGLDGTGYLSGRSAAPRLKLELDTLALRHAPRPKAQPLRFDVETGRWVERKKGKKKSKGKWRPYPPPPKKAKPSPFAKKPLPKNKPTDIDR